MQAEKSVLLDCEYFPSISWYRDFLSAEQVCIEQFEFFVRKTGRNRCVVVGPNGKVTLSVPLLGGRNQKARMKDLRISYSERWPAIHWRTLDACYRRSPFFEEYEEDLRHLLDKKPDFLLDLNLASIEYLNRMLKVTKSILLSDTYEAELPAGCIDRRLPAPAPVSVRPYLQPFSERHGFVGGLSMLDMLFCCGPAAPTYILSDEN